MSDKYFSDFRVVQTGPRPRFILVRYPCVGGQEQHPSSYETREEAQAAANRINAEPEMAAKIKASERQRALCEAADAARRSEMRGGGWA